MHDRPADVAWQLARRLRNVVADNPASVCSYALCAWAAILGLLLDHLVAWKPISTMLFTESLAMAAIPWVVANPSSGATRARSICATHGVIAAILTGLTGGFRSPLLCWLLLIPLAAYVCGHPRTVAKWAILGGLFGLLLFFTPDLIAPRYAPTHVQRLVLDSVGPIGGITLSLTLGLLAALQHGVSRDERRGLESAIVEREVARRDFISKMSHELRTPLTAILGFAEDLAPEASDPSSARAAETIRRNSRALLASLDDLVEWEHLESGDLRLHPSSCETVRLFAAIQGAVKEMPSPQVPNVIVEYQSDIPDRLVADWVLLQRAVVKAVAGALQATGRGGIRLSVRFTADRAHCELTIGPLGHTWEDEELARLFAASSDGQAIAGAFSIALARGLLKALGGDVTTVSLEKSRSAALRITVPVGLDERAVWGPPRNDKGANRDAPGPQPRASRVEDARILLVEDSADTRALMTFLLTRAGAIVQGVDNGQAAITAAITAEAKGIPFDVVLMDMQLPLVDGCEATRRLRENGFPRPIIAFTAQSIQFSRKVCMAAGCDDYITKPFRSCEIIELVARHADRALHDLLKSPHGN